MLRRVMQSQCSQSIHDFVEVIPRNSIPYLNHTLFSLKTRGLSLPVMPLSCNASAGDAKKMNEEISAEVEERR